jgi:hypothetical protein
MKHSLTDSSAGAIERWKEAKLMVCQFWKYDESGRTRQILQQTVVLAAKVSLPPMTHGERIAMEEKCGRFPAQPGSNFKLPLSSLPVTNRKHAVVEGVLASDIVGASPGVLSFFCN